MAESNIQYANQAWKDGAENYSRIVHDELNSFRAAGWQELITGQTGGRKNMRVLDIGCGPGFFTILLSQLGHSVTGMDATDEMRRFAEYNLVQNGVSAEILRGDAVEPPFEDNTFDLLVSRNVTWTLPDHPQAYREWLRILKPGGILLIFDANWHLPYLTPESRADMRARTENTIRTFGSDFSGHTTIESLGDPEAPAHPKEDYRILRDFLRPDWDIGMLSTLGYKDISYDRDITGPLWDDKEKMMYGNTPMFMIRAVK